LTVALLLLFCASCGSAAELARENTSGLTSDAIEGVRLAQQVQEGKAGSVFARAHAQELQDDVDQIREHVVDEELPGHQELEDLSGQVSEALGAIALHPDDAAVADSAEKTLSSVVSRLSGGGS
jgi:hypothetical protein